MLWPLVSKHNQGDVRWGRGKCPDTSWQPHPAMTIFISLTPTCWPLVNTEIAAGLAMCLVVWPLSGSRVENLMSIPNCPGHVPFFIRCITVATVVVWRCRYRTAACCVVHDSYSQRHAHNCEQFLNLRLVMVRVRYGHVLRKDDDDWVKKCMEHEVEGPRPRGRPKKTWKEVVRETVKHVSWIKRMPWTVANGERW